MNASIAEGADRLEVTGQGRTRREYRSLSSRERFLRACRRLPVDRTPAWMMRQAGRALPEYRKLKEKYSFLELAQTPELAAEVTLQPIRRFGFDAAIIFSDILVIPEAMGVGYKFRETGGVQMDFPIRSASDVAKLSENHIVEKLQYVTEALRLVRKDLGNKTALLGFAGSPWTLANYMLDGGSAHEHVRALALFRENRPLFELLCEKLTNAVSTFLQMQIRAGADAVQIFDSLGGLLPSHEFRDGSGVWIRQIVASLSGKVPVIVFSKGTRDWATLRECGSEVLGIDYGVSLATARAELGAEIALQGNLDPAYLVSDSPEMVRARVEILQEQMRPWPGYIFNLGHGLTPNAIIENIQAVLDVLRADQSVINAAA